MSPRRPGKRAPYDPRSAVDEELRFHLEMRARELERGGMTPDRAWSEALRRFGDLEATRAVCVASDERKERRMQRRELVREFVSDVVHGARQLRRRPAFAAVTVATLAVAIGAATAIFSAADHVVLRPLPYAEPDRVVTVWETRRESSDEPLEVAIGNFLAWHDRMGVFERFGLAEPYGFDLTGEGPPEPLRAWLVTDEYFDALGVRPLLGRTFAPDEYVEDSGVVLVSHGFWQRRLGGDPGVVGSTLRLDGGAATVIGVLPPALEYPDARDLWAPKWIREYEWTDRSSGYTHVVGRLRPGVTLEAAQAQADRVADAAAEILGPGEDPAGIRLIPLGERVLGDVRPALLVLLGAVGFLLLIACVNVAGLLLARGIERERELAIRAAHGAGRARLVRQWLTESLLLAAVGGALGVIVAYAGIGAIATLVPAGFPRAEAIALDGRVLAAALGLTAASALLFGVAPALRFSNPDTARTLAAGGRTATTVRSTLRIRNLLVAVEVALALVMLVAAGLLGRSFGRLLAVDPGFEIERRGAVQLFLTDRNPTVAQRHARIDALLGRFAAHPEVEAVAAVSALPFHPSQIDTESAITVDGGAATPLAELPVQTTIASPGYFDLMEIPVVEGRTFTAADRADAPPVALVSETVARRLFPDGRTTGRRITFGVMGRPVTREVVGVVGDVRPVRLDGEPRAEVYIPYNQSSAVNVTLVVRARGDAAGLLPTLQQTVWDADPEQTIYHTGTLEAMIGATLEERRFQLALLGAFSIVALALAAIGIYGLISFATQSRSRELGIRLALGAGRRRLLGSIVGQGLRLAAAGTAVGLLAALGLARLLRSMLFGIQPADPRTLVATATAMLLVAAAAAAVPAWRAARTPPASALRND